MLGVVPIKTGGQVATMEMSIMSGSDDPMGVYVVNT